MSPFSIGRNRAGGGGGGGGGGGTLIKNFMPIRKALPNTTEKVDI